MKRRELLLSAGAAVLGMSAFPAGFVKAAGSKKQRVLYFTRSAGFEHPVVARKGKELSFSEKVFTKRTMRQICGVI